MTRIADLLCDEAWQGRWSPLEETNVRPLADVTAKALGDAIKRLPLDDRLALLPELLGVEAQLLLRTMGEAGPVHYYLCDLNHGRADTNAQEERDERPE